MFPNALRYVHAGTNRATLTLACFSAVFAAKADEAGGSCRADGGEQQGGDHDCRGRIRRAARPVDGA